MIKNKSGIKPTTAGFTIVELLIVIVVIGILAAITIVAYNGIQDRARVSAVSSGLKQTADKLAIYYVDNSSYPANLATAGIVDSASAAYQYSFNNAVSPQTYCVTATNGSTSYKVSSTATAPSSGGCAGHGVGGVGAITNIATNPGFEANTTSVGANNSIANTDNAWAASGSQSLLLSPNSGVSNDSFFNYGGDLGALRMAMQAGQTYTISATIHMTGALTGLFNGNGARQITAWHTVSGLNTLIKSNQAPNSIGDTRLSVTISIPATATGAWLRFYHGGYSGSGNVWFDNIIITEGSTQYNYYDGASANWLWTGAPHNSTSFGPPF